MKMSYMESPRFLKGIGLIEKISSSKLHKLVTRTVANMDGEDETPFSGEEEEKLCDVLKLTLEDLKVVLDTIWSILQKAAFNSLKPATVAEKLVANNMSEEKSEIMSQAWQKYGREIVNKLKKKTLSANRLEKVAWHLNLQAAQGSKSKLAEPNAIFQFGLKDDSRQRNANSNLVLEFNHNELLMFYNKLEVIQEQMDALT